MKNILQFKGVSHRYDRDYILRDISFSVKEGDFLGIVGDNGSGKSTLVRLLLGLLPIQQGEIYIKDTLSIKFSDWSHVSFVSQKANSFNTGFPATVTEVVNCGLITQKGLSRQVRKDKCKRTIEMVGLTNYAQKSIGELSGGQQQRVFIARALVSDPVLLVLDEPTVGLDSDSVQVFWNLLDNIRMKKNVTIVMVSHDIELLTNYATNILVLRNKIDFFGVKTEFIKLRSRQMHDTYGCVDEELL